MYHNGQQDAIWEVMLDRKREARNVSANVKRGASAARRVTVSRRELAAFEAHCSERAAKNALLRQLRTGRTA